MITTTNTYDKIWEKAQQRHANAHTHRSISIYGKGNVSESTE